MNIFIPKYLTFGADIKHIHFSDKKVTKSFKNNHSFYKTIQFYDYISENDSNLFPILYFKNEDKLLIETENCGNLLSLFDLPNDWIYQINKLRSFFQKNNILILDIRFMPHTPYVINNLCLKNNKIYLVDLALYETATNQMINTYFDNFIYEVKVRHKLKNNLLIFPVHFILEIKRLLCDLFRKIKNNLYHVYSYFIPSFR